MPGDTAAQAAPPVAHAIGGAIGSALALLLFFPLERARIELQAQASLSASSRSLNEQSQSQIHAAGSRDDGGDIRSNRDLESIDANVDGFQDSENQQQHNPAASTPVVATQEEVQHVESNSADSPSSSSWTPIRQQEDDQNNSASSPSTWSLNTPTSSLDDSINDSNNAQRKNDGEALIPCLMRLHHKRALYQGVTPVITTIATSQFVFFYLNEAIKQLMVQVPASVKHTAKSRPSPILSLLASCLAGIGNVLITSPLWVRYFVVCIKFSRLPLVFLSITNLINQYRSWILPKCAQTTVSLKRTHPQPEPNYHVSYTELVGM